MAPQSFQLVMRTGPTPGRNFALDKSEISIGRDIANDIVINDAEVSRRHSRLVAQAGGFVLEDTGSTNGTFVNGQRLMGPHVLRPGELILLGENVSLVYEPVQEDLDATRVSGTGVPVMPPSQPQAYAPPQAAQPSVQPPYTGVVPEGPPEAYETPYALPEEEERQPRTWLYVGCGCLVAVLCLLAIGAYVFDYLDLYCVTPFRAVTIFLGFTCP